MRKASIIVLLAIVCVIPLVGLGYYLFTHSGQYQPVPFSRTELVYTTRIVTYSHTSAVFSRTTYLTTPCPYCLYAYVTETLTSYTTSRITTTSLYTTVSTISDVSTLSPYAVSQSLSIGVLVIAIVLAGAALYYFGRIRLASPEVAWVPFLRRQLRRVAASMTNTLIQRNLSDRTYQILRLTFFVLIVVAVGFVIAGAYFLALVYLVTTLVVGLIIWPSKFVLHRTRRRNIVWHSSRGPATRASRSVTVTMAEVSIGDLLDPVTGVGFNQGEEVWQCANCSALYHSESRDLISQYNASCCVVCKVPNQLSRAIPGRQVSAPVTLDLVRRFRPEVITITDVGRNVGRIVVFEGGVVEVQRSRTSETFAVKFQRGRWVDAFKVVIFPQYVRSFPRGERTIKSYAGHRIRVRGLIQRHDIFGLQVIVNREDMIEVLD